MNFYHDDDIPDDLKKYFQPAPQIGLEKTPEEYVDKLVAVFREVRRVLKKDGVCFVNLGDSYATPKVGNTYGTSTSAFSKHSKVDSLNAMKFEKKCPPGLKPKDLVGIPWMVAFALRADGWWLRQDIIWSKPNPMPESVKDRCTKSHEYIFLLTKSAKYFWDQEAVMEDAICGETRPDGIKRDRLFDYESKERFLRKNVKRGEFKGKFNELKGRESFRAIREKRNLRSVWEITTQPTKEAHFATFPEKLVETCIKAGSRIGDIVLDPFGGSMTTGRVAKRLNRQAVLIELNTAYCDIKKEVFDQNDLFCP